MPHIETARSTWKHQGEADYRSWLTARAIEKGLAIVILPAAALDRRAAAALAYVNHSRWVADCPEVDCGGAMLVDRDLPFFCANCFNGALGGRWRPLVWPDDPAAIETELLQRPRAVHRNWRPGETVEDLRRENAERGVSA